MIEPEVHRTELPGELTDDVGWLLGQVLAGYFAAVQTSDDGFPGAYRGLQVLNAAVNGCSRNQLEVAHLLGIDRTVMVRLVDDLEGEGLVERRPDPADRRARIITPTDAGRCRLAEVVERIKAARDHVLAPLDPSERIAFLDALRRMATALQAEGTPPGALDAAQADCPS